VETAEHAAIAVLARRSCAARRLGLLAAVQSFGNLAASATAGLLWTLLSARVALGYLAAAMVLALNGRSRRTNRRLRLASLGFS
jgi:hypothetical protein